MRCVELVFCYSCKAFETMIGTVCMPLCTNVHPPSYLLLFSLSLLAVYLKV